MVKRAVAVLIGLGVAACTTVERSLIFATETSSGLHVSLGGQTNEPIEIDLGYKRWEGVLNPVYDKDGISSSGEKYRADAYSVIAKFSGEIKAVAKTTGNEASGALVASQWFATGEAATLLAGMSGTPAILTDNEQIATAASLGKAQVTQKKAIAVQFLAPARDALKRLAKAGDDVAKMHAEGLDEAAPRLATFEFLNRDKRYSWGRSTKTLEEESVTVPSTVDLSALVRTYSHWYDSWIALSNAEAVLDDTEVRLTVGGGAPSPLSPAKKAAIRKERPEIERVLIEMGSRILGDEAVQEAFEYVLKQTPK